ncbi:MAG: hypothetical protein AB1847_05870 [bacterium]
MNIVVSIGEIDEEGHFRNPRWFALLKWLRDSCNNLRIYTKWYRYQLGSTLSKGWSIEEEPFPDQSADMRGFRLWLEGKKAWDDIVNLLFDIDNGISHIYFLDGNHYIGELEVEDGENFIVLHVTQSQEIVLLNEIPDLRKNVEVCRIWHSHIDGLMDNAVWKPLGGAEIRE